VIALVVKCTELERTVAAQWDRIARLKGLKDRHRIKPSGIVKASQAPTENVTRLELSLTSNPLIPALDPSILSCLAAQHPIAFALGRVCKLPLRCDGPALVRLRS